MVSKLKVLSRGIVQKAYIILIFIFLYAPIFTLIIFSFNDSKSRAKWSGFTLKWYKNMFADPVIVSSLYYTIVIAIVSSIVATIIGTLAAIGINNLKKKQRKIIMNLTYVPVLNPDIVTGIALMLFFIAIGIKLGFNSMLLAHITFNIPYVILCVLPKLKQLDNNMYEAALDLGATPIQSLYKVILPEIMPGVVTGLLLAFTLSLDDFVISYFTTGNGVSNLSITIYTMTRRGIKPEINALSTIMFLSVLILLIVVNLRMNRNGQKSTSL